MPIRAFEARRDHAARCGEEVYACPETSGVRVGGDQSDCPEEFLRYANDSEKRWGRGNSRALADIDVALVDERAQAVSAQFFP
jgi:hypothetical protein